jgi:hypothetical protein
MVDSSIDTTACALSVLAMLCCQQASEKRHASANDAEHETLVVTCQDALVEEVTTMLRSGNPPNDPSTTKNVHVETLVERLKWA